MAGESLKRFVAPVSIAFNQAIIVAVAGLIVNGISAVILTDKGGRGPSHADGHAHDHNLRSAYLHVVADALTSILAIGALLCGKFIGWNWMDPMMGIVGAILVARWSIVLLRDTSMTLLDGQAAAPVVRAVREAIESDSVTKLTDAHIWSIGPGIHAAVLTVSSPTSRPAEDYRKRLPESLHIVHSCIEVVQGEADRTADRGLRG